jgi:hypothetical protein
MELIDSGRISTGFRESIKFEQPEKVIPQNLQLIPQ